MCMFVGQHRGRTIAADDIQLPPMLSERVEGKSGPDGHTNENREKMEEGRDMAAIGDCSENSGNTAGTPSVR